MKLKPLNSAAQYLKRDQGCKTGQDNRVTEAPLMSKNRELEPSEIALLGRLDTARQQKSMSWQDLSASIGKSRELGNQWSGHRSCPTQRDTHRLASILGVTMGWLLAADDPDQVRVAQTEREERILAIVRELNSEQQAMIEAAAKALLPPPTR
jgi:ribosome-binding protein aMBF1 (putative translation factor)